MVPVPTTMLYMVVMIAGPHSEQDMTLAFLTKPLQTKIRTPTLATVTLHRQDTVMVVTSSRHFLLEIIIFHQQK